VDKLKVSLMKEEKGTLTKHHTESTEAYQAYHKGMYSWSKRTTEDTKRGLEYFQEALEHDSNFALAYVGLANSYITLSPIGGPISPKEGISKAKAAALKALDIDSTLGEAHTALAFIYFTYERNWEEAEKEFKLAMDLSPGYATAHQWYSDYLLVMERFEDSLNEVQRANELDPLSPIVNYYRGDQLYYMRQYDQALEEINDMLEMFPDFGPAYNRLGLTYLQKGMCKEAIKELQKAEALTGRSGRYLGSLGYAYAMCGHKDKALQALEELTALAQQRPVRPLDIAEIYIGLQDKNRAFEWIEKANKARTFHVLLIKLI
jgi:tetratricopeptide (TPR) repeat protein